MMCLQAQEVWQPPVGCCLWGHTKLDMTEVTQQQQQQQKLEDARNRFSCNSLYKECCPAHILLSIFDVQNCMRINYCFMPLWLWVFVVACTGNLHADLES